MQEIYLAGGCLWGVQEFFRHIDGVVSTEAGRANGRSDNLTGPYDGYAECVRIVFDSSRVSVTQLVDHLFEIIDPYSINQQGEDVGEKYRTGIYSCNDNHLQEVYNHLSKRTDFSRIQVENEPLTHYIASAEEHQDRLQKFPDDYCHLPKHLVHKYRSLKPK